MRRRWSHIHNRRAHRRELDHERPGIAAIKEELLAAGAGAAGLSGSGSAVFGLFRTRQAAVRMLRPLAKGGARTVLTRTLTRAEHERRSRPVAKRA